MVWPTYADLAPVINHFSHGLLDTAVRSMALMGLISLAVLGMRRASAATRHWVWLMGFVGLLLLPLLSTALPGWRVLPHLSPKPSATVVAPVVRASEQRAKEILPDAVLPPTAPQRGSSTTDPAPGRLSVAAAPVAVPAVQPSTAGRPSSALTPPRRAALPWTFWLALVWLVGSVMVLVHLLLGYLSLWLLQRRCARIDDGEWHQQLNRLRQMIGVRRAVKLLSAPGRTMPMTWGVWRANLLLPDEAANWTSEQRKDVLLHELGHVRRFDCATQLLVQIACALYWFNPLVWFAWNRVQVERERACDDIVLNTGTMASSYAQHLLESATAMPALRFVMPALAMARPSTLESRLCTILDTKRNRRGLSGRTTFATLGLLLIALVPVAVLHAQENTVAAGTSGAASVTGSSTASGGAPSPNRAASSVGAATRPAASSSGSGRSGFRNGGFGVGGESSPQMGEGPTCAFGATIYDVRLPADKIGLIDREALNAAAATPAGFEKALADLGATRPLYRTDQTVRLASDTITIATQTPTVTSSRMDNNGRAINSIQYQQTGAIFEIAGRPDDGERMECDLKIQLSAVAASSEEIAPNVKASLFRTATMSHKGAVRAKEPFVVLSADAASLDEEGRAVVFIARVTLGTPQ